MNSLKLLSIYLSYNANKLKDLDNRELLAESIYDDILRFVGGHPDINIINNDSVLRSSYFVDYFQRQEQSKKMIDEAIGE